MKRVLACLGVALLSSAAAGCGDDEKALSTEEFLAQGNAICSAGNDEVDAAFDEALPDSTRQPSTEEVVALFTKAIIPNVRGQIKDLRDLNPPKDLEADVDQLLDDATAALDGLEQQIKDDPEAVISSEEDPFAEVDVKADAIGLTACANDEDDSG